MTDLQNRVAIITGASSGIGEATAHLLAKKGVKVVLAARRVEKLEKLKNEIEKNGGVAEIVVTDVSHKVAVQHLADYTIEKFGKIDYLINNAGLMPLSFVKNLHVEEWEKMIDVNVKGVMYAVAAVLPNMRENKYGHIINISSVAGKKVMPGSAVYSATKFAVRAFTEGLRMELSPKDNIRATSIEPGAVATELTNTITDDEIQQFVEKLKNMEMLNSEDIARSILYALEQPQHVNIGELLIMPKEQG